MRASVGLLAILAGLAWAAGLGLPRGELVVDDGGFLSLPLSIEEPGGRLEVAAPPGFRLLSAPQPVGSQLLNFYVERGLAAGRYTLRVRLWRPDGSVLEESVAVRVRERVAFELRAPPGRQVVLGEAVEYLLELVNLGNVADVYRATLQSRAEGVRLEPRRLELGPGERGTLRLKLHPQRAQPVVAIVEVRSGHDPGLERRVGIVTKVVPFAGAGRLGPRSLHYRLELSLGPNSTGWSWRLGAGLGGALSDYVRASSSARWTPEGGGLRLGFTGDWGRVYLGAGPEGWGLELGRSTWSARAALGAEGWRTGLRWRPDPWSFSLAATASRLRLQAGLRFSVARSLRVEPWASLDRWFTTGANRLGGGLNLGYDGARWLGGLNLSYADERWSVSARAATREQRPFGLRLRAALNPEGGGLDLRAQQEVRGPWSLEERLGWSRGRWNWAAGLRYLDPKVPWRGGLGVLGRDLRPGFRMRLGYRVEEGGLGGWAGWLPERAPGFGLEAMLRQDGLMLAGSYERAPSPRLGVRLSHAWEGWRLGGRYTYDLRDLKGEGAAEVGYTGRGWGLEAGIEGDAAEVRAWAALLLRWEGGFATPEALVELFGGRRTGRIQGRVYADTNRDGRRQPDEPVLAGALLSCGGAQARTDEQGRYRLEAAPGRCRLEAHDAEGRLGLAAPLELSFERGRTQTLDLGLVPVAALSGEAWADANGNGVQDPGERRLAGVRVVLEGPGRREVRTGADGRFVVAGLPPGSYRLQLGSAGLPRLFRPAAPLQIELEPGPLPFVAVAAVPVERRTLQTFRIGDVALFVDLDDRAAPPGAEVGLRARVQGAQAERVVVEAGGESRPLEPQPDGSWRGFLRLPDDARGLLSFRVRARTDAGEVAQEGFVLVRPGPLAAVQAKPALVDPGGPLELWVRIRRDVPEAEVLLGGQRYPLERVDRWTWRLRLTAPAEPGRHTVEVWAGGRRLARGAFRVSGD